MTDTTQSNIKSLILFLLKKTRTFLEISVQTQKEEIQQNHLPWILENMNYC